MALLHQGHIKRPMLSRSFNTATASGIKTYGKVIAKFAKGSGLALLGAVGCAYAAAQMEGALSADELMLEGAQWDWGFKRTFQSYDHAALRRGFQVYREVCAACHTVEFISWRHHINVTHTEAEIKALAAEYQYPEMGEEGEFEDRPGKTIDYMPRPYPNEIKARMANNGALPPDLSLICLAREDGENYLFNLLMGYEEVPPGQPGPGEGQAYNPVMHGNYIAMAQQIYNETVDYEDETPAYASQISKDVTAYFAWTADLYKEHRETMGMRMAFNVGLLAFCLYMLRRKRQLVVDTQKLFRTVKPKE